MNKAAAIAQAGASIALTGGKVCTAQILGTELRSLVGDVPMGRGHCTPRWLPAVRAGPARFDSGNSAGSTRATLGATLAKCRIAPQ